ncbi:MAG: 50S ribosomal protein L35 [bacterium]
MGKKNKIKTRKGVAKRFKVTGTGKIVHHRAGTNHFGRRKRGNRKRALRVQSVLQPCDARAIRRSLGKIK